VKKILFLLCMMIGSVYAETSVPLTGNWNNVTTGTHPNDCCTGGPSPLYDPNTGIIHFSYSWTAVHRVIAINQALSDSGIQINGYNWGYDLRNMNGVAGGQGGTDEIYATSFMTNSVGQFVHQSDQYFNTQFDWTRFTGTETLSSSLSLENSGSLGIQFVSRDAGFWAGYYGPQVRNVEMTVNYTSQPVDPCTIDPLYSSSCPGYASAYHDQQCSANPLYATTCSGYQSAYYTQQCSIDPLYDSGCPGYQASYFNQQCSLDALYDSTCTGYAQAYFDQQCSISGLYDRSCPNYAEAYATQQLLSQQNSSSSSTQTVVTQTTSEPSVQVSSKGEVSTEVQLVADPTVNEVLKESTKKDVSINEVAAPVATRTQTAPVSQPAQKAEQKQEQKKTDTEIAKIEKKSDSKDSKGTKTNNKSMKEAVTEKAKELANEMSNAATLESQTASQGLVLGLMNYNPAFSAYANAIIPDSGGVEMVRQYNKPTVDNRRALRALSGASDRLHDEMVQQQYR
jgi:hypothetical protein